LRSDPPVTRSCATIRSRLISASSSSISGLSYANISSRLKKTARPSRATRRALVYQRAKQQLDTRPFGTHYDVYRDHYEWLHHSIQPKESASELFRTTIGGAECTKPYSASVFNISAMSYGSLSANAIRALNKGAKLGDFAHDTGEGGASRYHRE
jgi:glutamate synthase domain-containing protein 2